MFTKKSQSKSKTAHCNHCVGKFGRCACPKGCPANPFATECSIISKHCHHCMGGNGDCGCTECPIKPGSHCKPVHVGFSCSQCGVDAIRGDRYSCVTCDHQTNLCVHCYLEGSHPHTHEMNVVSRPGSKPIPAIRQYCVPIEKSELPSLADAIVVPQSPVKSDSTSTTTQADLSPKSLTSSPDSPSPPVATLVASEPLIADDWNVGQVVRLCNLSNATINGKLAKIVGKTITSDKLIVKVKGGKGFPMVIETQFVEDVFPRIPL